MKVYLMTAVDTSYVHEMDTEDVLRTGEVYATLEKAKEGAQKYVDEEIENFNEMFTDKDQQRDPLVLSWEESEGMEWVTSHDEDEYETFFMIREQNI